MWIQELRPTGSDPLFFSSWFCQYRSESAREGTVTTGSPRGRSSIGVVLNMQTLGYSSDLLTRYLHVNEISRPLTCTSKLSRERCRHPPHTSGEPAAFTGLCFAGITGMLVFFVVILFVFIFFLDLVKYN